jgi:predicted nucleic-acid-binding protein
VIALDTHVIARFYVDDPSDSEALAQRPAAKALFESGEALFVALTVLLELEWVLRAFYDMTPKQFEAVVLHLSGLPHVTVERISAVHEATNAHVAGLDFADALHLACSAHCQSLATFDDKRFARRANRLGLQPTVRVIR